MNHSDDAGAACPHDVVVSYLRGRLSDRERMQIEDLREGDATYAFLFELIDELKSKVRTTPQTEPNPELYFSFSQLEQLLARIFSGAGDAHDAQQFMDALQASPLVYERLLALLPAITPALAMEDLPQTADVEIRSDEEILDKIVTSREAEKEMTAAGRKTFKKPRLSWLDENLVAPIADLLGKAKLPGPAIIFAVAAVLIAAITIPILLQSPQTGPLSEYTYDDKVPYEYRAVIFRSLAGAPELSREYETFQQQFKAAMADYTMRRYQPAIDRLTSLQPMVERFRAAQPSDSMMKVLRDHYFYLGVAHLGRARTTSQDIPQAERTLHTNQAVENLTQAQILARSSNLNHIDRDAYYLAIAYGFTGQYDLAKEELDRIDKASEFYDDAIALRQALSEAKRRDE